MRAFKTNRLWSLLILAFSLMAAPTPARGGGRGSTPNPEVAGNNRFALNLYDRLEAREGNLFFSPFSVRTALGMTRGGARNRTATQMDEVLCFATRDEALHRALVALGSGPEPGNGSPGYSLSVANSLWSQRGYPFLPEYLGLMRDTYGAGGGEVDFAHAAEAARKQINEWVEQHTRRRIKNLLQPEDLGPTTVLVLANAIHFKGSWVRRFDEKQTRDRPFFPPAAPGESGGERKILVPTMHQTTRLGYLRDKDLTVLELPYHGEAVSMVILLPSSRHGLGRLEASLTPALLRDRLRRITTQEVALFLPRFRLNSRLRLKDPLIALGMTDAFDGARADFSGMTGNRDTWIDRVIHQAFVKVNEEGTEAAAATAVVTKRGGGTFVHVNHPFLFLIRDRRTGAILFLGRVVDPSGT
jgi:serpin B